MQPPLSADMSSGASQDPHYLIALQWGLRQPDPILRRSAALGLGQIASATAVTCLLEAWPDPDEEVRRAIALALCSWDSAESISGLHRALQDPEPRVRATASWGLARLGVHSNEPIPVGRQSGTSTAVVEYPAPDSIHARQQAAAHQIRYPPRHRRHTRKIHRATSKPNRRAIVMWGAGLVALLLIICTSYWMWNTPLGPALAHSATSIDHVVALPPSTSVRPQCDGPQVMQLLFIGSDTPIRGDYSSGLGAADVIRVVRFDFVHVSASTLVVPRDLWGPIPGMERYGVYEERVKAAYAYGNVHAEFGNGPSLLALTLNRNFGLSVDHYLVVNRDVFVAAIDAMGGLAINISEPIGDIAAGPQILDGEAALRYTRLRPDNSSDLERIQRQNLVIEAIQVKIYSPDVIPRIPRLLAAFHGAVVTDLAPDDIQKLVCLSEYIDPESIRTFTIDESVTMSEMDSYGYEILLPDKEAILNLVADFQSGQYFELTSPDSLP